MDVFLISLAEEQGMVFSLGILHPLPINGLDMGVWLMLRAFLHDALPIYLLLIQEGLWSSASSYTMPVL